MPVPLSLILENALRTVARDPWVLRRVEDGRLHEDMLLAGLCKVACEAGADIRLVCRRMSPAAPDQSPERAGASVAASEQVFLDMGQRVLGLFLGNTSQGGASRPVLRVFAGSREDLLRHANATAHVTWQALEPVEWMEEEQGMTAVLGSVENPQLAAQIQQAVLHAGTPAPAPRAARTRL